MNTTSPKFPWLDLINQPAFCVENDKIIATNSAAEARMIEIGTHVKDFVADSYSDYSTFCNGKLHLTVCISGIYCKADVSKIDGFNVFVLEKENATEQLQSLAVAAQQLRIPLMNVITITEQLWNNLGQTTPKTQNATNQVKQNLYQLMRIIGNMSDASYYQSSASCELYHTNLTALFQEIIEKARTATKKTGIAIQYTGIDSPLITLANPEKLERAVFNMLSNALKFTERSLPVEITFSVKETTASFSVCNSYSSEQCALSFWNRYGREPSIEDSRNGLGLGMALITSTALCHGGTVLIDYPTKDKIRVTMTIAIRCDTSTDVRSPILKISDYAGCRDKTLLELSEILTPDSYSD